MDRQITSCAGVPVGSSSRTIAVASKPFRQAGQPRHRSDQADLAVGEFQDGRQLSLCTRSPGGQLVDVGDTAQTGADPGRRIHGQFRTTCTAKSGLTEVRRSKNSLTVPESRPAAGPTVLPPGNCLCGLSGAGPRVLARESAVEHCEPASGGLCGAGHCSSGRRLHHGNAVHSWSQL